MPTPSMLPAVPPSCDEVTDPNSLLGNCSCCCCSWVLDEGTKYSEKGLVLSKRTCSGVVTVVAEG